MISLLKDFISLLFPDLCLACGNPLIKGEEVICIQCQVGLPRTNFHHDPVNPVIRHFWGKVPIHAGTAYYYFHKGEKVQRLIHQLKYKNRPEVGHRIGRLFGHELSTSDLYKDVDVIMPVPLHKDKQRVRGYNQSEQIAIGMAASYNRSYSTSLKRTKHTETQTHKHRFQRYQNVDKIFSLNDAEEIYNKHVLLVDDVITTGSTLAACAEEVLKANASKVSVAAAAYAAK
jgi:ComF family protein